MIGDTVTDVRAALAAGAQSMSVLCGFGTEKELLKAGTHAVLPSTSLLSTYLMEAHLETCKDFIEIYFLFWFRCAFGQFPTGN
jgi:ribonucleotide monophosphatase NagD (HAD superfamily)